MVIVGRTKIPYNDLFICTQSEIDAIIEGHEIDHHAILTILRRQTSKLMQVHVSEKDLSKIEETKLWSYPWDAIEKERDSKIVEMEKEKDKQNFSKLAKLVREGKIKPKE